MTEQLLVLECLCKGQHDWDFGRGFCRVCGVRQHIVDPYTDICRVCNKSREDIRAEDPSGNTYHWNLEDHFGGTVDECSDVLEAALCDADKRDADPELATCRRCLDAWYCFTEEGESWRAEAAELRDKHRSSFFAGGKGASPGLPYPTYLPGDA